MSAPPTFPAADAEFWEQVADLPYDRPYKELMDLHPAVTFRCNHCGRDVAEQPCRNHRAENGRHSAGCWCHPDPDNDGPVCATLPSWIPTDTLS